VKSHVRRPGLDKWTREALVEAFVAFLAASFRQTGVCRILTSQASLPDPERHDLRTAVIEVHDLETDILTRLRLLAPSRVVKAAETVHEAEHRLVAVCFEEPLPRSDVIDSAVVPVRRAHAQFLEAARSTLRLSDTAAIGHHHRDVRWHDFLTVSQAPAGEAAPSSAEAPPVDM
jgi:hypothetical protein